MKSLFVSVAILLPLIFVASSSYLTRIEIEQIQIFCEEYTDTAPQFARTFVKKECQRVAEGVLTQKHWWEKLFQDATWVTK